MKKIAVVFVVAAIAVISACSTDVNVLANYKETMIVYGLLDQSDTAQYIKINKAFLGPGNALQMAQVFDSSSYRKQLLVQLQAIDPSTSNVMNTITLSADSSIAKPDGVFSSPKQILYKTKAPLNNAYTYKLIITNTATHTAVTGTTPLVQNLIISKPYPGQISFNFADPVNPFTIQWTPGINGKVYGVTLRFHYWEKNMSTSVVDTTKYIDWVFANQTVNSTQVLQPDLTIQFMGQAFYQYLATQLPVDNNVRRYLPYSGGYNAKANLDLIFSVGANDLYTFIQVNQPSTGIVQERPQYTNLTNGYGIFSSRYTQTIIGKSLGGSSVDSLYEGVFTHALFCSPDPISKFYCN